MSLTHFRHAAVTFGLTLASLSTHAQPAAPPSSGPVEAAEQESVLEMLAQRLESSFVFPEAGAAYAKMLRERLRTKEYASLTEPAAFAAKVTADLQAVQADGHLKLEVRSPRGLRSGAPAPPPSAPAEALAETKMIGDLAYLKFTWFPPDAEVAARARKFLLDHAEARGLIIDARDSRGGTVTIMDAILPLLFAEKTTLVRMDTRLPAPGAGGPGPEPGPGRGQPPASMVPQAGPTGTVRHDHVVLPDATEKRLQKVPVVYLTSKLTRSAAEHFAMALQRTGRGRVIGETTAGAGHFGGLLPIGERFSAFIPVGRSYDPETGRGWEGTGIVPNVAVPAAQALEEALKTIRTFKP